MLVFWLRRFIRSFGLPIVCNRIILNELFFNLNENYLPPFHLSWPMEEKGRNHLFLEELNLTKQVVERYRRMRRAKKSHITVNASSLE